MDAKYIITASGEPPLSWVTMYTIGLSFISFSLLICSQSKGRDIIFLLRETQNY